MSYTSQLYTKPLQAVKHHKTEAHMKSTVAPQQLCSPAVIRGKHYICCVDCDGLLPVRAILSLHNACCAMDVHCQADCLLLIILQSAVVQAAEHVILCSSTHHRTGIADGHKAMLYGMKLSNCRYRKLVISSISCLVNSSFLTSRH